MHKSLKQYLKPVADIRLIDAGSLVGFLPATKIGHDWIEAHLDPEPWQYLGSTLYVDQRCARDIMQGMIDDDLKLGA
jgi:hypothetical protein